jgi:hypothetical protein
MSDDLLKRLDQALHFEDWMPVPDDFSKAVPLLRESRNHIEELERKLAKAVEALKRIELSTDTRKQGAIAMATLAELNGEDRG